MYHILIACPHCKVLTERGQNYLGESSASQQLDNSTHLLSENYRLGAQHGSIHCLSHLQGQAQAKAHQLFTISKKWTMKSFLATVCGSGLLELDTKLNLFAKLRGFKVSANGSDLQSSDFLQACEGHWCFGQPIEVCRKALQQCTSSIPGLQALSTH